MTDSCGREESFGLKYPRVVGGDPDCLWAVLILEPLNLFLAFNNQKALVYNETKLCVPPEVLLDGILQCQMRVSIKQGELTTKGVYVTDQGQRYSSSISQV